MSVQTIAKLQDKTVNITSNGEHTINPDSGYTAIHSLDVNVDVKPLGNIQFYDFDGTLVASYTGTEVQALTELPSAPDHSTYKVPLAFDAWNWTLADIKGYNTSYPDADIIVGANYHTIDGKLHFYVNITSPNSSVIVSFNDKASSGNTIDWGDESGVETITDYAVSHTYNVTGYFHCVVIHATSGFNFGAYSADRYYSTGKISEAYLPNSFTQIQNYGFSNCRNLVKVSIPSSTKNIGTDCFYGANPICVVIPKDAYVNSSVCCNVQGMEVLSLPMTLSPNTTELNLYGIYGIKSLTIPTSITSIVSATGGVNIKKLVIPDNITSLTSFLGWSSLEEIDIPDTVTSMGSYAFGECGSLKEVKISENVTTLAENAFSKCYNLQSITLPSKLTSLSSNCLQYCLFRTITLPSGLTSIGTYAFQYCSMLQSIIIPDTVTSIGKLAFFQCDALQSVVLSSALTIINQSLFANCSSLESVVIPSGVTSIDSSAFSGCRSLSVIKLLPTTPPTLSSSSVFKNIPAYAKFYVPYSADHSILTAYKAATNWDTFASQMEELPE